MSPEVLMAISWNRFSTAHKSRADWSGDHNESFLGRTQRKFNRARRRRRKERRGDAMHAHAELERVVESLVNQRYFCATSNRDYLDLAQKFLRFTKPSATVSLCAYRLEAARHRRRHRGQLLFPVIWCWPRIPSTCATSQRTLVLLSVWPEKSDFTRPRPWNILIRQRGISFAWSNSGCNHLRFCSPS